MDNAPNVRKSILNYGLPDIAIRTIDETGCEHVIATHGYTSAVVRYLQEKGRSAAAYHTRFTDAGEDDEQPPDDANVAEAEVNDG